MKLVSRSQLKICILQQPYEVLLWDELPHLLRGGDVVRGQQPLPPPVRRAALRPHRRPGGHLDGGGLRGAHPGAGRRRTGRGRRRGRVDGGGRRRGTLSG